MVTVTCMRFLNFAILFVSVIVAASQNQMLSVGAPSVSMNFVVDTKNKIVTADGFPYHRALVDVMKELGDVRTDLNLTSTDRQSQCQRVVNLQTNMTSSFQAFEGGMTALLASLKPLSEIQKSLAGGQGRGAGQGVKIVMSGDMNMLTKSKPVLQSISHKLSSISGWVVAGVFAVLFLVTLCVLMYCYRRHQHQTSTSERKARQDDTYYEIPRDGDQECQYEELRV